MKPRIQEAIVVEGRYDRNSLSQVVDALILETSGFGIFKDDEQLALLRRLADTRGLILLTDPDGAGFVIRNYLKGALPKDKIKQAYVPDIHGKERRKRTPGKEGKLGVEGMSPELLLQALQRAGATFIGEDAPSSHTGGLTMADFYALGLTGTSDATSRRAKLLQHLELPARMSTKALLAVLNTLYSAEEAKQIIAGLFPEDGSDESST